MDPMFWIVLALVVGAVVVYLLTRQRPQLPGPADEEPKALPKPAEKLADKPAARREPEPTPAKAEARPSKEPKAAEKTADKPVEAEPRVSTKPVAEPEAAPPRAEATAEPAREIAVAEPAKVAPKSVEPEAPKPVAEKPRDVTALKKGLAQTRTGWMQKLLAVFSGRKEIDPALLEQIEETLLTGDVGTNTTKRFVDSLKGRLDRKELADADTVWETLKGDALAVLDLKVPAFGSAAKTKPMVILMVGVNGAGKTTTIAKLADRYKDSGKSVLLAAGDTFRAAAVAQLEMWGKRVGVPVHKGKDGAKPGAVVYEAVAKAVADGVDVVIADTAGRLQTKAPLMEELRKIREACGKACPGAPHEVLLVLDATTGQNAISQAREFRDTLDLTGVVLTKLDGTARGGVILAIAEDFKLPVRFVGVGEKSDDLREFDARDFVDALFARDSDEATN